VAGDAARLGSGCNDLGEQFVVFWNDVGAVIFLIGIVAAFALALMTNRLLSRIVMVAGLCWASLDLAFRSIFRGMSFIDLFSPSGGGQIMYIPLWVYGVVAVAADIKDMWDNRGLEEPSRIIMLGAACAPSEYDEYARTAGLVTFVNDARGRRLEARIRNMSEYGLTIEYVVLGIYRFVPPGASPDDDPASVGLIFDPDELRLLEPGAEAVYTLSEKLTDSDVVKTCYPNFDVVVTFGSPVGEFMLEESFTVRQAVYSFAETSRVSDLRLREGIAVPRMRQPFDECPKAQS
jgi:hypothetical protein